MFLNSNVKVLSLSYKVTPYAAFWWIFFKVKVCQPIGRKVPYKMPFEELGN
jgi:hypothetical protein